MADNGWEENRIYVHEEMKRTRSALERIELKLDAMSIQTAVQENKLANMSVRIAAVVSLITSGVVVAINAIIGGR